MAREPLRIRIDRAQVREIYDDLSAIKNGAPKAMSRAINHTLGVTRTESSTEIRKQVKLKAGYVRDKLKIRKATVSKPQGAIRTPTRGTFMTRYPYRQYKNGDIGVQIKPTGGKQRMSDAFLLGPLKNSGAMAIAQRTARHRPGTKKRLQGIKLLYGPSVSQVFTDVKDDLQAPSGNRLMQRLAYEADRLLKKQ